MGLLGGGILAVWNDIAPGGDAEFNHWHTREHVPERVGVGGFLRGRRYVALRGSPKYFTLYETETVETLASPAYLARLNDPTPWTRRALPLFRNTIRTACRITESLGRGMGGVLATLRLGPLPGREEELRAWLTGTSLPALVERPGLVGAHLCEADLSATRVPTEERKLRTQEDDIARWVVLVEGTESEAVEAACHDHLSPNALGRRGASGEIALSLYRLLFCLSRESAPSPSSREKGSTWRLTAL
ncbi:MAG: hypothetical protein HY725_10255 [Candidatus Rokubacteria bacterium]|nr:hypothetical protein [Candidatus Rokubacteria bacterium]